MHQAQTLLQSNHNINFDIIKWSAIKQRKQNYSLNKKNKKKNKTFKVQKNLCTGAHKKTTNQKQNKLIKTKPSHEHQNKKRENKKTTCGQIAFEFTSV